MVTKEKKRQIVAEIAASLDGVKGFYMVDFTGMTVLQMDGFRNLLRPKNAKIRVAKNTLIKLALEQVGGYSDIPDIHYARASAVILSYSDAIAPAKILKEFSDKNEGKGRLKCAMVEGQYFDGKDLKVIASLPTREELIAGILGSINAPASGIVGSINAVMRDLTSIIEEVAKKQAA